MGFLEVGHHLSVTPSEMRKIEEDGEAIGISKLLMMENAGSALVRFIFQNSASFARKNGTGTLRVLFVAGTGNNGGDAFVAARHLAYWSDTFDISVVLLGRAEDVIANEAKVNLQILSKVPPVKLIEISSESLIRSVTEHLDVADVVVVGIFGTGFRGEPRPLQKGVIEMINKNTTAIIISVDLPSGLEADSGNSKIAVRSDFTITMHAPKVGMLANEASRNLCGHILIANIGVPL